ncbi:unnamed protein product, partial [Rhizophagus irregularis]
FRFSGLWTYGIQHFERFKRSLNVWNLTFRRFSPASTLALDI